MSSIRINLLPHREQKRQARQRQFYTLMISLAVLALAVIALVHGILAAQIDSQESRNRALKTEIAKLDEQIKEIDRLRDQIQAVLARKQVVETLQANRSEAVHLLDQLVRQLPDGIYLRSVKQGECQGDDHRLRPIQWRGCRRSHAQYRVPRPGCRIRAGGDQAGPDAWREGSEPENQ